MKWTPGELDQRVAIVRETLTSDSMGGATVTTATVATVWAKVIARSGREREQADRLAAEAAYTFVIRWRGDVLESDRLSWRGQEFNIRAISQDGGRKLYLEIDAERGVANGP